jgi:hypothetical protein
MKMLACVRNLALVAALAGLAAGCGEGGISEANTGTDVTTGDTTGGTDIQQPLCQDLDGDGFFAGPGCQAGMITDCNDNNNAVSPGAPEVCGNGVDDDCKDGDEPCADPCEDKDGDGALGKTPQCAKGTDCVDTNDTIKPGAKEICGNGVDENCDGKDDACPAECPDADKDGYVAKTAECAQGTDCDDADKDIHPGAPEICGNGVDDNCDGKDEVCPPECKDGDGDGYGDGADCKGYDCNDANDKVNPGAEEVCGNGIDDDCIEGDAACPATCEDKDGDSFGVGGACPVQDCDDANKDIFPGQVEICGNTVDENCDGEADACVCLDKDGDGYGTGQNCLGPDCNDSDPLVNPGAAEVCGNGLDDDCKDGDQACTNTCTDADKDGYGIGAGCKGPDCLDSNPDVHPGANDICENGIDEDCDNKDAVCPEPNCETDYDCGNEQMCDGSTGTCRYAKVWEWWAPTFYVDTDTGGAGLDLIRKVDFDGDWKASNNVANLSWGSKDAVVYYSFVKTSSHWFLGYYVFFPKRWTSWWLGTQYENTMRGVLLVVEQDGSTYGKLVLMETMTEDTYFQYVPPTVPIKGSASDDGDIHYDWDYPTDHHPIVYVHSQDHGIWGDAYWANNVARWDLDGFPGDDGVEYMYGAVAESPATDNDVVYYNVVPLVDTLWAKRLETGDGEPFEAFGQFGSSGTPHAKSLAPWRFYDGNSPLDPHGELLYDPADLVRRHFKNGWGAYSFNYSYNPYAIKVTLIDLQVTVTADPFGGLAEPYVNLYLWDGSGYAILVASNFNGLQNNWYGKEQDVGYVYDLAAEMGRNFFYGLEYPTDSYFGIEVKDYDGGWSGDDWLMNVAATDYSHKSGKNFYDWGKSNAYVQVDLP